LESVSIPRRWSVQSCQPNSPGQANPGHRIDSQRPDHLGRYNYPRNTSTNIDADPLGTVIRESGPLYARHTPYENSR